MTCKDFEPFLFAYVDGEFEGPEKAAADTHLAECEACRNEVEAQRAFKRRVREAAATPSPANPGAPAHLRANLVAALAKEPAPSNVVFLRPRFLVPAALATAASVAVIAYFATGRTADTSSLVRESIAHHQIDLPLDVQDPQLANVQEWLRGKVDFAPSRIPNLRPVSLRGARLSNLNGHRAAYVVYGGPSQRRVTLLVFDAPELRLPAGKRIANRDVVLANQRGYNVAVWKDREIAYSLVSDLDEQDMLQLIAGSASER